MLSDTQLDAYDAEIQAFRSMSSHFTDIVCKYESLLGDYRTLRSDYEEEHESRERYKRQARAQDRNPFVLLLVDGHGYIFNDDLLADDRKGGPIAAQMLEREVRQWTREIGHLDPYRILVRIYIDLAAVSRSLSRVGLAGAHARSIAPFASAFTGAKAHFDIVDTGEGDGSVTAKITETFRLFAENSQCKHIFFAGCHNACYLPLLHPYLEKISLVKSHSDHPEYKSLPVIVGPLTTSVFRNLPLSDRSSRSTTDKVATGTQAVGQSMSASPTGQQLDTALVKQASASGQRQFGMSSNHAQCEPGSYSASRKVCIYFSQKGACKWGKDCRYLHPPQALNAKSASRGHPNPQSNLINNWDNIPSQPKSSATSRMHPMLKSKTWRQISTPPINTFNNDWITDIPQPISDCSVSSEAHKSSCSPGPVMPPHDQERMRLRKGCPPEVDTGHHATADYQPRGASQKGEATKNTLASTFLSDVNSTFGNANGSVATPALQPTDVDFSDLDSDSDPTSASHPPETDILDLGLIPDASKSNSLAEVQHAKFDGVVRAGVLASCQDQSKSFSHTSLQQSCGSNSQSGLRVSPRIETNLMDDDWGNPPENAGMTFAETAEPVDFDNDCGSAPFDMESPCTANGIALPTRDPALDNADYLQASPSIQCNTSTGHNEDEEKGLIWTGPLTS